MDELVGQTHITKYYHTNKIYKTSLQLGRPMINWTVYPFSYHRIRQPFSKNGMYAEVSMHVHFARLCFVSNGHEHTQSPENVYPLHGSNQHDITTELTWMHEEQVQRCFHK